MTRNTQVNHRGDRECHETTLTLKSQSDSRPKHYPFLIFVIFLLSYDVFVQKNKTTTKTTTKKGEGRLESNQNTHSFCFFVTFLFGILQHLFIFRFLGIKVEQPLPSCTVYATIICLAVNKSFCTLS